MRFKIRMLPLWSSEVKLEAPALTRRTLNSRSELVTSLTALNCLCSKVRCEARIYRARGRREARPEQKSEGSGTNEMLGELATPNRQHLYTIIIALKLGLIKKH